MSEIIRYTDEKYEGLAIRYIDGLTLFDLNSVAGVEDAMVTFLRALVQAYPCAAQVGLLPLEGDEPREVFAPLREGEDYLLTHVNSYAHGDLWVEPNQPAGCFFPHLTESFFELRTDDGRLLIDYLLEYDHPFLYVNVDDTAREHITALYAHPPLADEFEPRPETSGDTAKYFRERRSAFRHRWWREITRVVPLGLWGGHDQSTFTAYSRDPAHFHLLDPPLTQTCAAIRATPWFQAHQHELRWPQDEGLDLWYFKSLMLPNLIEQEKADEAQRQESMRQRENADSGA